jgi:acid phosphatase family membrane protein YuiD
MTADLGLDWALFWLVVITALLVVHDRLAVRRYCRRQARKYQRQDQRGH